jgi:hypothetical protein
LTGFDPQRLHQLLDSAVPALPHPADRLESIARRTHRSRTRTGLVLVAGATLATAATTVLATALTAAPGSVSTVQATRCPGQPYHPDAFQNATPRRLVPPGATAATFCIYPAFSRHAKVSLAGAVLTRAVDRLTTTLNQLPTTAPGGGPVLCGMVGMPTFNVVLTYPHRPPAVIDLNLDCYRAVSGSEVRFHPQQAIDSFAALYRDQLAAQTDPRTLTAARCPGQLAARPLSYQGGDNEPIDEIIRGAAETTDLPAPIAVAAVCRYARTGSDHVTLVRHATTRTALAALRTDLMASFAGRTLAAENCEQGPGLNKLDIIWATDVTGATQEIRVFRGSCPALVRAGYGGFIPVPGLLTDLDRILP